MSYEGVSYEKRRWSLLIDLLMPLPFVLAVGLLFGLWEAITAFGVIFLVLRWIEGRMAVSGWQLGARIGAKLLLVVSSFIILPFAT